MEARSDLKEKAAGVDDARLVRTLLEPRMESELLEKIATPAQLATGETLFVSAHDCVVSTHPGFRLLSVWRTDLKCLALNFAPIRSTAVYSTVRRVALDNIVARLLVTDRTVLYGPLVTAACSLPRTVSVTWGAPTQEQMAAMQDLVNIGQRLAESHRYSSQTIQAVYDGWGRRFNAALEGEVSPVRDREEGVPRVDWLEMYLEHLQSQGAAMAMAIGTLRSHVPRPFMHARERQFSEERRAAEELVASDNVTIGNRAIKKLQPPPARRRIAAEVAKTMASSRP